MSREIKFRIWDKKNAKFISKWERVFINVWECCVYTKSELEKKNFSYNNDLSEIEVNQFTGLKDKKGCEIYDGDIIKLPNDEAQEVIFWGGVFCYSNFNRPLCDINEVCEIIGNIYENSELLND